MQVPLSYAEDIIGVAGSNIAYIRRTSGAILSIQESRGLPDEITVEIKGTSSQVQMAQQLIQVGVFNSKLVLLRTNIFPQPPPPTTPPHAHVFIHSSSLIICLHIHLDLEFAHFHILGLISTFFPA